jgi:hypothetical protein
VKDGFHSYLGCERDSDAWFSGRSFSTGEVAQTRGGAGITSGGGLSIHRDSLYHAEPVEAPENSPE